MLNSKNIRELVYLVEIKDVIPHPNADRLDIVKIGGWDCICGKGEFKPGDHGVYFEIDSQLPAETPFSDMEFLAAKHYKIKTQKIRGSYSQGLLVPTGAFLGTAFEKDVLFAKLEGDEKFLTSAMKVTYATAEERSRKGAAADKYKKMAQHYPNVFKTPFVKWLYKKNWGKKLLYIFFGHKKHDTSKDWPVGRFPGVAKTDQERVENMTWVLQDKTPFIVTQKCDGSSGTYILEKKGNKFEFYVCSRNVRMKSEDQECFYGSHNYYWEVAKKYDIEDKMKQYMAEHPECTWVCWQGEICAPSIQGNPHNLSSTHFYCFHWTDSASGRMDIRHAAKNWEYLDMEVVPIVCDDYILPDDFDEFKLSADGYYDESVCEGSTNCKREGFVYYKSTDPNLSFKNVSRSYLMKHNG